MKLQQQVWMILTTQPDSFALHGWFEGVQLGKHGAELHIRLCSSAIASQGAHLRDPGGL